MIPKILNDVTEAVRNEKIKISEGIEGEDRVASLIDEGTVIDFLLTTNLSKYITKNKAREFGDMIVLDYDGKTQYVVNIKTSIGSSDNATSKIGFLYAFTDMKLEEMPGRMNWPKFLELIKSRKADIPNKDYWFICVDKNDSSNVTIRGAKQINCWKENANPSNMLQIDWKKEKVLPPKIQTYDEAYDVIVNGILRCILKFVYNLPKEWKDKVRETL